MIRLEEIKQEKKRALDRIYIMFRQKRITSQECQKEAREIQSSYRMIIKESEAA